MAAAAPIIIASLIAAIQGNQQQQAARGVENKQRREQDRLLKEADRAEREKQRQQVLAARGADVTGPSYGAGALGYGGNIRTSPLGLPGGSTYQGKTLLGQ